MFEQKAVAGLHGGRNLRAHGILIEPRQHPPASVWHLHQQGPVAPARPQGPQYGDIAAEINQASVIAFRQIQIQHALVGLMQGIDRIMGNSLDPLIGTNAAKGAAIFVGFAA